MEKIEEQIFNTDIIYVGGGNTRFMLEKWRELGVDKLLIEAYNKGIVCSGLSAGSYCWFKCNYDLIEGLGLINIAPSRCATNSSSLESRIFSEVIILCILQNIPPISIP